MNIHIVDSVKGGSGKSTFALKMAIALKFSTDGTHGENKNNAILKPIIVDLDIMGTSWIATFQNMMTNTKSSAYRQIFLNDLVIDWNHYKSMNFIRELQVNTSLPSGSYGTIDLIPCSNEQSAKERFKIDEDDKSRSIQYDVFRSRIVKLIEYLDMKGYTDIILDMPPNSEPYSNCILKYCLKNFTHNVNLYMVAAADIAHLESNMKWYNNFIKSYNSQRSNTILDKPFRKKDETKEKISVMSTSWYKKNPHRLVFVVNDIFDYFGDAGEKKAFEIVKNLNAMERNTLQSLIYLFVSHDIWYYNFKKDLLIAGSSIASVKCSEFLPYSSMHMYEDLN